MADSSNSAVKVNNTLIYEDVEKLVELVSRVDKAKAKSIDDAFEDSMDDYAKYYITKDNTLSQNKALMQKKLTIITAAYEEAVNECTAVYNDKVQNSDDGLLKGSFSSAVERAQTDIKKIKQAETLTSDALSKIVKLSNDMKGSGNIGVQAQDMTPELKKEIKDSGSKGHGSYESKGFTMVELGALVLLSVATYSIMYGVAKKVKGNQLKSFINVKANVTEFIRIVEGKYPDISKTHLFIMTFLLLPFIGSIVIMLGLMVLAIKNLITNTMNKNKVIEG